MLRATSSSLGAFAATTIALRPPKVVTRRECLPKYEVEMREGPTAEHTLRDPKMHFSYVSTPLRSSRSLGARFGRIGSMKAAKSAYAEWFNSTYNIDLKSDAAKATGVPSLSNSSTVPLATSSAADEAYVAELKDYPAEEMDDEMRRVARNRIFGIAQ